MAAIRNFFKKKKSDAKFKMAGRGRKLDEAPLSEELSEESVPSVIRARPSESSQRAGAAALARLETKSQKPADMSNRSQTVIRAEALKELEAEKLATTSRTKSKEDAEEVFEGPPILAVDGVYFSCSLIGPDILPKDEMKAKIRDFLYQQLEEERGLTSCLIIHTCNSNREKVRICIQTLSTYLENIIAHPDEEKYRKIRVNNKAFQERIACMEGTQDFLLSAGFTLQSLTANEGDPEQYYVFTAERPEQIETLKILKDAILSAEPIRPHLDRNLKVLAFLRATPKINLPPDFYNLTVDEIKKEQQLRTEQVRRNAELRTRAMREQDEAAELRHYKYTLLRIRFPDDIFLQGTFSVRESISSAYKFVRDSIKDNKRPFFLVTALGLRLSENEATLMSLQLVPAVILNFIWDPDIEPPSKSRKESKNPPQYLKKEIKALLQEL